MFQLIRKQFTWQVFITPILFGRAWVKHNATKHYVANLENYIIENKRTFGDLLVSGITLGIYTPTTTKFYVPENNSNAIVTKKKFHSKSYKGYLKH